jgi:hypothetical protein
VISVLFHYSLRGFHNPRIARKFSKTRLRAEIEERKKAEGMARCSRAKMFIKRLKTVGITEISLHSYR